MKVDHVFVFELLDVNFRSDKDRFFRRISAARIRIEHADLIDLVIQLVNVATRIFRKMLQTVRLQVFEVISNEIRCQTFTFPPASSWTEGIP